MVAVRPKQGEDAPVMRAYLFLGGSRCAASTFTELRVGRRGRFEMGGQLQRPLCDVYGLGLDKLVASRRKQLT